jgi:hypothetical protein
MQGPSYLDLAKVIASEHRTTSPDAPAPQTRRDGGHRTRQWVGLRLIHIGERMIPKPAELQLKVSTGPPCP